MGRPPNTAQRRRQIVAGLRVVLAHKGYAGATIADIARAARLAPGLVHYHFPDKRAVLLALIDDLVDTLRARLATRDARAGTARERLIAFIDAAVALGPDADASAVACWVGIAAEAVREARVRDAFARATDELVAELIARVRAALAEAGAPTRAARSHAALLWSAVQGSFTVATLTPSVMPRGAAAPALRALVDHLLHTHRQEEAP